MGTYRPARDVPELGEAGQRDQLADAVLGHERLAAGLVAREPTQRALDLSDLTLERVDSTMLSATKTRSRASSGRSRPFRNARPAGLEISLGAPALSPWW
jgi:hypothetical protein